MKKLATLICCLALSLGSALAQGGGSIVGTLKDSKTGEGINGAVVELTNLTNQKQQYYTSGYKGHIEIRNLQPAEYKILITFLGYEDYTKQVKVTSSKEVNLGTISFKESAEVLENIEVKGYLGTSQKGDTVSYNASAFKTVRDASAEGLLSKMPGITVNSDGSVDAQGETVQKVFVDGKEFFGEDVSTTIKTIPAEMVAKVEVYDKLSDKAEFTGLDDGEGYKAINIVTSLGKRRGLFGKVYGSYGYADKYSVGGNANIFNGDEKLSIITMANNINQLNFSFEDIVGATSSGSVASSGGGGMRHGGAARNFMVRPMSGISTVQSLGLNYANEWEKLELQGSYFVNHSTTVNEQHSDRTTYSSDSYTELLKQMSEYDRENWNHRVNMRLDYEFSKTQSLMVRLNASLQKYANDSYGTSLITNGETGQVQKDMEEVGDDERLGTYGNIFALYRTRLNKPGRTLTLNAGYNWNSNESLSLPVYTFHLPTDNPALPADSVYQRHVENLSNSNRIRGEISYTEPINEKSQATIEYEFSHKLDNQDKQTEVTINNLLDPTLGPLLSNISKSGYTIHQIGPGYNLSTEKVKFSFKLNYQISTLNSEQILPAGASPSYNFQDITYRGNATINFNKQNVLRLRFRSNTSNPSLSQLQEAVDVSGSSYTEGNPNLKPSYSHNFNAFYTNTNIEKGRTFMIHGGMWGNTRSIITSSQINNPDFIIENYNNQPLGVGNTYTTYENYNKPTVNIYAGASYGFPINFLKSNFTFNVNMGLNRTPSKLNGLLNMMKGQYYSGGVQIGSNISENLDFTLAYNFNYSINDNSTSVYTQLNEYLGHYARAEFKWVAWKGFTLTANGTYSQYKGITDDYNEEILLCNAYIGKKLFKDERGELSIGVNDIFNQNRDFRRDVGSNYIQNTTNLAIGRYVAVQFVYNLRFFGKGSSAKDFDNMGMGGPGGRGPMRPHGGMHR